MKIIAGSARGRNFKTIESYSTRPTLNRIREAIFDIIQFYIPSAYVLDLFAGSGAMGLEALSRGAAHAVFADNNKDCALLIKENSDFLRFSDKSRVIFSDYKEALRMLANDGKSFDVIFLDPPYAAEYTFDAILLILQLNLLKKEGIIVSEHLDTDTLFENDALLKVKKSRRYGETAVTIYELE